MSCVWWVGSALGAAVLAIAAGLVFAPKPWTINLEAVSPEDIKAHAQVGLWWAGLAMLFPLTLLAASARFWVRSLPSLGSRLPTLDQAPPRWFWPLVVGAMLVFAILGAFRLPQSLWDDESYVVRKMILGSYRVKDDGSVKLKPTSWEETLWYYQMPANHGLQTILSRLSLEGWRMVVRPGGLPLSEVAVRLPSYLAGILSIGALALLVARLGFPQAGVIAAWLLALHPWHLRLSPEARGYAFVFLLIPVCCLLALRAVRSGSWGVLAAFAVAEFALLYTWPGALLTVCALNLAALFLIFHQAEPRRDALPLAGRWLACGVLTATALMPLVFPWLPQLSRYLKDPLDYDFGMGWLKNLGALLVSGAQWAEPGGLGAPYLELSTRALAAPWAFFPLVLVAAALVMVGVWRLWKSGIVARALLPVLLLPGPAMYLLTRLKGGHLHEWYLAFLLPPLLACAAIGLPRVGSRWVTGGLAVVFFTLLTMPERRYFLTQSIQPFRESVLLTRPNLDPNAPENRTILTTTCLITPVVYDPLIRKAFTGDELKNLMRAADARGGTLFANNGYFHGVKDRYPEIHALLTDQTLFELVAFLPGSEPCLDRSVHRYRSGSLKP